VASYIRGLVLSGQVHQGELLLHERPATEIDQRLAPSLRPIARQFVFRRHHRVRQKLQDVLARDADMRPRVRGRQRWSLDVRNVREILAQSFEHRLAQNAVPRSRR